MATALPLSGKVAGELNQPIRPHVTKVPTTTDRVTMRGVESSIRAQGGATGWASAQQQKNNHVV